MTPSCVHKVSHRAGSMQMFLPLINQAVNIVEKSAVGPLSAKLDL